MHLHIKLLVCLLPGILLSSCSGRSGDVNDPNIIFILIDDMGWKDVGFSGSSYYDTPNIDKLASEGMKFKNAYSAAPVCTPSRGAIFSGKCPARTKLTTVFAGPAGPDDRLHDVSKPGNKSNQYFEARHRHALPGTEVIFVQALVEAGYTTGFFGKWHIGECPGYYPGDRGFQVAKGYRLVHGKKYGHWGDRWPRGNFANLPDPQPDEFIPETLTRECIKFIKENRNKPFMAFLSHYIVHSPSTPKPEIIDKYQDRDTTDQNNAKYAALVESVDESVGDVMKTLKELDLEENTIVIFTSDNGGLTPNNTSNYPLMGGKSFPFEGGMRVPLVIKWPGKIKPGITSERVIGMDFYPTVLEAANLPLRPYQHVDGISLMPLLTEGKASQKRSIVFHFPHYTHATGPFSSIIADDWKLIRFYNDEEGRFLLYNLSDDCEEQNDLAAMYQEKRDSLAMQLSMMLKEMGAEMPVINPDYNFSGQNVTLKNLRFTKNLAEKERKIFEHRLNFE